MAGITGINDDEIRDLNVVKDIVLAKVFNDNLITQEQYTKCLKEYHIIMIKPKWFTKLSNFFNNKENKDKLFLALVKLD